MTALMPVATAVSTNNPFLTPDAADVPDMLVPKTMVRVYPAPSRDRPNMEKTTRDDFEAVYAVPLIKNRWGIKAAKVEVYPIGPEAVKQGQTTHQRVRFNPHLPDHCEAEAHRLQSKYGESVFFMIYPGESFRDAFNAVAKPDPAHPANRAKDSK